ncbi:MAG: Na+/H+ antiporter subunit E [Lachnospiraceae bacterium]|nr:Na+/H+ antiporter subunit E [Candidatus Merdinaster equi]
MYILLFLLWIVFNGQFTWEIAIFGVVVSALVFAFMCAFMDYSIKKEIFLLSRIPYFLVYVFVLIREIIKANIVMAKYITVKQEYELHPVIFRIDTKLKSHLCRTLLANAITLTPGTITVSMEEETLIIHAVDESLAIEEVENFVFEGILLKLEGGRTK